MNQKNFIIVFCRRQFVWLIIFFILFPRLVMADAVGTSVIIETATTQSASSHPPREVLPELLPNVPFTDDFTQFVSIDRGDGIRALIRIVFSFPDSLRISWQTNVPTREILNYGLDETVQQGYVTSDKYEHLHEAVIHNLLPNQMYFFRIFAFDQKGNLAVYDDRFVTLSSFTTPSISTPIAKVATTTNNFLNQQVIVPLSGIEPAVTSHDEASTSTNLTTTALPPVGGRVGKVYIDSSCNQSRLSDVALEDNWKRKVSLSLLTILCTLLRMVAWIKYIVVHAVEYLLVLFR